MSPTIRSEDSMEGDAWLKAFERIRASICPRCLGPLIGDPEETETQQRRGELSGVLERRVVNVGAGCATCGSVWYAGQDGDGPWFDEKLPPGATSPQPMAP